MDNLINIKQQLPRAAMAKIAKKYRKSKTTIAQIASGENNNYPEIYADLLSLAEKETARRKKAQNLAKQNQERAKMLINQFTTL